MKQIIIDCSADLHSSFAQALSFPSWYGRNLDALHDMLTSIRTDTALILRNFDPAHPEAEGFQMVLADSAEENPHLTVLFE